MADYSTTRARVEDYFDRSATKVWERLTSDAPVSRIRQTVREGRDRMRALMLSRLPEDLRGLEGDARQAVDEGQTFDRVGTIGGLDRQPLGRQPRIARRPLPGRIEVQGDLAEIGKTH